MISKYNIFYHKLLILTSLGSLIKFNYPIYNDISYITFINCFIGIILGIYEFILIVNSIDICKFRNNDNYSIKLLMPNNFPIYSYYLYLISYYGPDALPNNYYDINNTQYLISAIGIYSGLILKTYKINIYNPLLIIGLFGQISIIVINLLDDIGNMKNNKNYFTNLYILAIISYTYSIYDLLLYK